MSASSLSLLAAADVVAAVAASFAAFFLFAAAPMCAIACSVTECATCCSTHVLSQRGAAYLMACVAAIVSTNALFRCREPPRCLLRAGGIADRIASRMAVLRVPYTPPLLWGRSGDAQTAVWSIVGRFRAPRPPADAIRLTAYDGGVFRIDLFHPPHRAVLSSPRGDAERLPIVIIAPGFSNTSEHRYVRSFARHVTAAGMRAVVFNPLGCLAHEPIGPVRRLFSYGDTRDLHQSVLHLRGLYPRAPLLLVGFSMGGNLALKYAAEHGDALTGVASLCQGYDAVDAILGPATPNLASGFYARALASKYVRIVARHRDELQRSCGADVDLDAVLRTKVLPEFDAAFTLKAQPSFGSVEQYYRQMSSVRDMWRIRGTLPVLLLNSLDDPMVPPRLLQEPRRLSGQAANVLFVLTRYGGHLGYFLRHRLLPFYTGHHTWLDDLLLQWIAAALAEAKAE